LSQRQFQYLFATALAAVVAVSLIAYLSVSSRPLQTNSQAEPSVDVISVTGTATIDVAPDQVTITFGVEARAPTPQEALQQASDSARKVFDTLLGLGLTKDEVRTAGYNIYPQYVYEEGKPPAIVGYVASHTIEVKTKKIDKTGEILDGGVKAGASMVHGISFQLSKERTAALNADMISAAVNNAMDKAKAALQPLGGRIVKAKAISVMEAGPPIWPVRAFEGKAEMPATPIEPGLTSYSVTVQVTFEIAQ